MDTIDEVLKMSFQDFRQQYSRRASHLVFRGEQAFFAFSTEGDYSSVADRLNVKGGVHVAIAGGIDAAFWQHATATPELSILIDIHSAALTYAHFRGVLLERCETSVAYNELLFSLLVPRSSFSLLEQQLSGLSSVEREQMLIVVANFREKFLAQLKHMLQDSTADEHSLAQILGGSVPISEEALKRCSVTLANAHPKGGIRRLTELAYRNLRTSWMQGRIKGFQADIYNGGFSTAVKFVQHLKLPITVLYMSNVDQYGSEKDHILFIQQIEDAVNKGVLHKDAIVIAHELKTSAYSPLQYAEHLRNDMWFYHASPAD